MNGNIRPPGVATFEPGCAQRDVRQLVACDQVIKQYFFGKISVCANRIAHTQPFQHGHDIETHLKAISDSADLIGEFEKLNGKIHYAINSKLCLSYLCCRQ